MVALAQGEESNLVASNAIQRLDGAQHDPRLVPGNGEGHHVPGPAPRTSSLSAAWARNFRYEKLQEISCEDAKATLDRVQKTGTGARNMETSDYICFYVGYVEWQERQADVICRAESNPTGVKFEAWVKK
jgi:hypothetical protein